MQLVSTQTISPTTPRSGQLSVAGSQHVSQAYNHQIRVVPEALAPTLATQFTELSDKSQKCAYARKSVVEWIIANEHHYGSRRKTIELLISRNAADVLPAVLMANLQTASKSSKLPKKSSLNDWVKTYSENGGNSRLLALAPKETGRRRKPQPWDLLALQKYHLPSKPSFADVAWRLEKEDGFKVTPQQVNRFISSLPATYRANSPWRVGKHFYQQNIGRYKTRDMSVLDVGEVYQGDGHTVDCYIAHPTHGGAWRPELTIWIDVRSKYIAGWYLSEAESASSTLFALSHALITNDHVPAWVHIDNGSGFKAKLMSDDNTGFYARFNIETTFSIPGNSKGKGLVEGWFRIFRNRHDKFFNNGKDYCGHDMAEEANRRMTDFIKSGKRELRSFREYRDSIAQFIDDYNNTPNQGIGKQTPASLWKSLEPVAVELPDVAVIRPQTNRVVQRQTVQLHNRHYEHRNLEQFEGDTVSIEYDLHDDSQVWIYDKKRRLICKAPLKTKIAYLPESRLEEQREKRKEGRVKRLQQKIDLARIEAQSLLDHNHELDAIEQYQPPQIEESDAPTNGITIDLSEDYDL